MNHNVLLLAIVPIAGFVAGFINTLAGTGSLITLPLLIFLGLPATVANGTWKLVLPAVVGSVIGARLAVDIDQQTMRHVIGVLMLVMLAIMMLKPERWIAAHAQPREPRLMVEVPLFFAIGVYGGFLQAGVGIFLLAALVLGAGFNLVGANGVKNLIVLLLTVVAIPVFVLHDQVQWGMGLLLGAGQAVGAWAAARVAIKRGAEFVRIFVIVTVLLSALALFAGFG